MSPSGVGNVPEIAEGLPGSRSTCNLPNSSKRQRSFNWQSTAFVMRGLRVRLPPLALEGPIALLPVAADGVSCPFRTGEECYAMSQILEVDIRDIVVANSSFGPHEIRQMVDVISSDNLRVTVLRDAVAELERDPNRTPASSVRLGVCQYLLGRYQDAIDTLSHADGGALTHFYLGPRLHADSRLPPMRSVVSSRRPGRDMPTTNVSLPSLARSVREVTRTRR